MKKKALLLVSIGVLACTVGVTAVAIGGANQLDAFAVKASPTEYSVTFNDDTPYQVVGNNYVFYEETVSGNKVGMVATKYVVDNCNLITFHGIDFESLYFFDEGGSLTSAGAYGFSNITYFDVNYSGGHLWFLDDSNYQDINGGKQKTEQNPPINPYIEPEDFDGPKATISSITIWYSC